MEESWRFAMQELGNDGVFLYNYTIYFYISIINYVFNNIMKSNVIQL